MAASDKPALRRAALAMRAAIPRAAAQDAARAIVPHILTLAAELPGDAAVAAFWPIRSEIDPRPALDALHDAGRPLALPAVEGGLVFRAWRPGDALVEGPFGARQPAPGAARVTPGLILVPLAAFDGKGRRLGYGGGYYDRYLADYRGRAIGLAFAAQRLDAVPVEAHDIALAAILTEQGLHHAR